jgi:hypothetical protein
MRRILCLVFIFAMLVGCRPQKTASIPPATEGIDSAVKAQTFFKELGEYWGFAKGTLTFKDNLTDYSTLSVRFDLSQSRTYGNITYRGMTRTAGYLYIDDTGLYECTLSDTQEPAYVFQPRLDINDPMAAFESYTYFPFDCFKDPLTLVSFSSSDGRVELVFKGDYHPLFSLLQDNVVAVYEDGKVYINIGGGSTITLEKDSSAFFEDLNIDLEPFKQE